MTDATIEDPQVITDSTSDKSKSFANVLSEQTIGGANDEQRTIENCTELEGRTEQTISNRIKA